MFYTYVLQSQKNKQLYVGFTKDLKNRIAFHNSGKVRASAGRRPLTLIYYEACLSEVDAIKREKFLKTGYGRRFLKNRLADHLQNS